MKFKENRFSIIRLRIGASALLLYVSSSVAGVPLEGSSFATQGYADTQNVIGKAAKMVVVNSAAEMQKAINDYNLSDGLLIKYTGTFDFDSIEDVCRQWRQPKGTIVEINGKQNITILGTNGSSANFGFLIKGNSEKIAIRNMTIGLLPGSIDAIGIEGRTDGEAPHHIWIDHNTLFSSKEECDGAGDMEFDGLLDNNRGAHHITYSYNYIHDHHKVGLMGSNDKDLSDRYVTFHHNYYENVGSRLPLQRGGLTHIYNNLYSGVAVSGINVRMGGYTLIESNYFENAENPILSKDSPNTGYWELKNNNISSPSEAKTYGITWSSCTKSTSCIKNASDWVSTAQYPETIPYKYKVDSFSCVKEGLPSVVGAGKNLARLTCTEKES
jgi:pectate lyase